jgi:nucleoside-diphosphate-sugar epimerase
VIEEHMAVLVTGGAGFVGLNVVEALLAEGNKVVLLDSGALPPDAARVLEPHREALAIERESVLDDEAVDAVFRKHAVASVIHTAAITSGPNREARDPASVVDVNLRGTLNVLGAARRHAVGRIVYVGSGAAYGESLYRMPRLHEETPSVPTSLYSITKHAAERMCLRLRELWEIDIVCVRLGTVIGPWERDTGARDNFGTHSQLARLALAGARAVLTAREIRRDWIYARDVARGLLAVLRAKHPRHAIYNLSSGLPWHEPIAAWCRALKAAYPDFSVDIASADQRPNIWYVDQDRGLMDTGRIEHDIGFRIAYPMAPAYADYLDWIRAAPTFFGTVQKNPG